jgi:predicted transcriptional regulator
MSSTFTVRIPKELKEKMQKLPVEWSNEIRGFIESRVKQLELAEKIKSLGEKAEKRRVKTDSTSLIREDRER